MQEGADERLRLAEPLVSFLAPVSLEADQYRTLRQLVEHRRSDAACQVLGGDERGGRRGQDGRPR